MKPATASDIINVIPLSNAITAWITEMLLWWPCTSSSRKVKLTAANIKINAVSARLKMWENAGGRVVVMNEPQR